MDSNNSSMDEMDYLYNHAIACADELLEENSGLAVAAVLSTISLSLYKTMLEEEDFVKMMDRIRASADQIQPFTPADADLEPAKKYLN